ncbi:tetratricopeptide repeat protein [bacterium]|nr:tetratricopeptide repeat protein [bacterium]
MIKIRLVHKDPLQLKSLFLIFVIVAGPVQAQYFLFPDSLLSQIQSQSENLDKLRKYYLGQLHRFPDSDSLQLKIAGTYLMQSRWPDARKCYRQILRKRPDDIQINGLLAWTYEQEGKQDSALMTIKPLAVKYEDNIALQFKAASLSEQISDLTQAINYYKQCENSDPENPWVMTHVGRIFEKMGQPDSARAAYLLSEKKGGTARSAYKLLTHARRQADTSLARVYQEKVIERVVSEIVVAEDRWKFSSERLFGNQTVNMSQIKDMEALRTMLRNVVHNWIPSPACASLESQIQALLKKHPDAPLLLEQLAYIYKAQKKWDLAIRVYERFLTLNPRSATGLKNLGSIYENQGQWLQAFRIYQKGLSLDLQNPEFYPLVIRTAEKAERLKTLSDRWTRLYQAHNDNYLLKRHLIAVYYQLGQNDKAQKLLHDFEK